MDLQKETLLYIHSKPCILICQYKKRRGSHEHIPEPLKKSNDAMNKSWIYNELVLKINYFINVGSLWVKSNCT